MANEKDSLYKILGTTAKISQRRVKEKYIKAVKEHPPEADPEQFEKIRNAYETLKDTAKRKQYDLTRKYGNNINKLLDSAEELLHTGEYEASHDQFLAILHIDEYNFSAQIGGMYTALMLEDMKQSEHHFQQMLTNPFLAEYGLHQVEPYIYYGSALIKVEEIDQAKNLLEKALEEYPDQLKVLVEPLAAVYSMNDEDEKALKIIETSIPSEEEETFEDIDAYIHWIQYLTATNKWSRISKVQSRFKRFLVKLDQDLIEEANDILMAEFEAAMIEMQYRIAEIYLGFVIFIDKGNKELKEDFKEVKKLVRVEKEIQRIFKDGAIFPVVVYYTLDWFYGEKFEEEGMDIDDMFPPEMIEELKEEKDYFAAGILQLKKKYPAIYNYYKLDWDHMFEELTIDYNREMIRGLKKLRL